jgi:hypothetical protein
MKQLIYTVQAYKYGQRDGHSYIVGVYTRKHAALKAADAEEVYRGNKYTCEICEAELNTSIRDKAHKVIKALEATS